MRLFKRALSWLESNPEFLLWAVFTYTMFMVMGYGFIEKELNPIGTGIGLTIWAIVTVLISYKQCRLVRERNYWIAFHEKYGNPYVKISVPFNMWCDFEAHFYLYDENGDVKLSAATEDEAVQKHKETGLYITRVIDSK